TGRVGDPSGRSTTRPVLDPAEIDANARTFQDQALKVLDSASLEIRFNSDWLDMPAEQLFRLMRTATVARILERDDFSQRYAAGEPISILELLYPLLQGYDSVAIRADVELGGSDQKFNLLLGRDLQRAYGQPEQAILTLPLLTGTDGRQKMSKSYGNHVGVIDSADEIFGRTLSIPDASLPDWYSLLLGRGPDPELTPRDAKRALARALAARYQGDAAADAAQRRFDAIHIRREQPDEMPEVRWLDGEPVHLPALLSVAFSISTSEARRGLEQGGVRLDGEPLAPRPLDLPSAELDGRVLQLGRRRFARIVIGGD
ncbi:MAG: tyrosine--tRNA ligase, partial [Solirubrobacteraceae bacterium]